MFQRKLGFVCGLAVCAATVLGLSGCGGDQGRAAENAEDPPLLVNPADVALVAERTLESGVSFTGELLPIETVAVVSRFDGDLGEVLVREGQAVRQGERLAVFRPREVGDRLLAAEAQLLAAQAALSAAENGERRARRLVEAGAAAPSQLEAAQAQRAAAQAMVDAAAAQRNQAQEDAEKLAVPSPIAGWVSQVFAHGGDRTAIGDRLMIIVDTSTLELSATVPSEALGRVTRGSPIRFRVDAFPGEVFTGEVDRVNPTTEPGTRQVRLYMRLPNPDGRLIGGLFASGRVIDTVREKTAAAPMAALRQEGQEKVVYRLDGGQVRRVAVRTGLVDEETGLVELIGSVAPGESLLVGVQPGLKDGLRVRFVQSNSRNGTSALEAEEAR